MFFIVMKQSISMKFCLLDADYIIEEGKPVIRLFGVNGLGKSVLVKDSFAPYFYVLPKKKDELIKILEKDKNVTEVKTVAKTLGLEKLEFIQVFVYLPSNIKEVRDRIKHLKSVKDCYEYTTNYCKRYLIDKKFLPLEWLNSDGKNIEKTSDDSFPKLKTMAFDIEVVDKKIVMISVASQNQRKVLTYKKTKNALVLKDEKEMIEKFIEIVKEFDPAVIFTYNGDGFDFPVMRDRCDLLKIKLNLGRDDSDVKFVKRAYTSSAKILGRIHLDLFQYVDRILYPNINAEIYTLGEISKELIDDTKEELSYDEMIKLWSSGKIEKFVSYCQKDSTLTLKLGEFMLPQIFELSRASGQLPFDAPRMTFGLLIESYLTRTAHNHNIVSPNQPHWNEIKKRREKKPFKGGYVIEPKLGLHRDIAVFDFRSLYPSIIVTYNISPETLTEKEGNQVPELKYRFSKKTTGIVPRVIKELIEKRAEIKKEMKNLKPSSEKYTQLKERQNAMKLMSNAAYGMLAYSGARWYCQECAESAAAFGRHSIKKAIDEANKFGFTVIYGDTDSLFVTTKCMTSKARLSNNDIEKKSKQFLSLINKSLPGIMELNLEGIYKQGIFVPQKIGNYTAKKRYALLDKKGNLTVRGLETVRRDWCPLAKKLQKEVIRLVLTNKEKEAVKLVKETVNIVSARKIKLEDIVILTQLGKELSEYKTTAPHIAVARKLEKSGHLVSQGTVIRFIIKKGPGSISERAELIDNVKLQDYDIDYYVNQVISVSLRILQIFGYKETDFLKEKKSLKDFKKKTKQ